MLIRTSFALLFLAFFFPACSQSGQSKTEVIRVVSPKEFQAKLASGKGVLLDVRTPAEYKKGHLKDARLLNIFDDNFEAEISRLDPNAEYYVYCGSGGRSNEAAELMQKKGFKKVYDMDGGFGRWKAEGLPVEY